MFQPGFRIRLILSSLMVFGGLIAPALAQSDDVPDVATDSQARQTSGFASSLGKIFGRSDSPSSTSTKKNSTTAADAEGERGSRGASVPGKPSFDFSRSKSIPAQTTGSRGGGIFVPLRSFTNRVFRGGSDVELSELPIEVEQEPLGNSATSKINELERAEAERSRSSGPNSEAAMLNESFGIPRDGMEGNEVGSALKSGASPKKSVEPFSNNRNTSSSTRSGGFGETQRSSALPPPPSVPLDRNEASASNPTAANSTQRNIPYSGAQSGSVNSAGTSSMASGPSATPRNNTSVNSAPIIDATPNLEEKSTSRRVPEKTEGIVESLDMPEVRPGKPTSLVDLSDDRPQPTPTKLARPQAATTTTVRRDTGSVAEDEEASRGSVGVTNDEPSVVRNRVPDSRGDTQPLASGATQRTSTQSAGLSAGASSANRGSSEQPKASTKESTGSSGTALLEANQPGISLQIVGPNAMVVGQETVYELVAKNYGSSNLNGLIVRLALPNNVAIGTTTVTAGVTQPDREDGENALLWEIESIAAGQIQSLKLPLQTSSPEHFAMNVEWTALPQSQVLQVKVHEPKLDLALEGPAEAEYGVPLNYRLRIKNPGNATVKNVEVRLAAESFGSNQSVIGDIAPGSERVIDVELLFEQSGVIPMVASAASVASQVQAQSQIEVRVRQAKLIAKWEGSSQYYQGSVGDYRLILTNEGDAAINQAKCSLRVPAGAEPVALPPGSVRRGDSVQWDVKKMMPGESVTVPFRFTFSKLGQANLIFKTEAKNVESVEVTHTITVDAVEDLNLAVVPPVAPAPVDQPVPYEIEIHNRGTKAAQNVAVLAQFSEGIEPVKVEGHQGQIVPGQVIFQSIPSIGPNERITLKVFAKASSSGIHRFRAEVKGSSGESDLVQEGSTRYMASGAIQPQMRR